MSRSARRAPTWWYDSQSLRKITKVFLICATVSLSVAWALPVWSFNWLLVTATGMTATAWAIYAHGEVRSRRKRQSGDQV